MLSESERRFLDLQRVAHLATADRRAVPHVVPVCFAISGDTLYRYASEGFIPAFKLGNRWRFKKALLDAWMDEKSGVKPAAPVVVMPKQKKPVARAR